MNRSGPSLRRKYPVFVGLLVMLLIAAFFALVWRALLSGDANTDLDENKGSVRYIATNNSLSLTPVVTEDAPFSMVYSVTPSNIVVDHWHTLELMDNGMPYGSEFIPQTNGAYLVYWNTTFATFGSHTLQICLIKTVRGTRVCGGPLRTEYVTNLIRFDPASTSFGTRACISGKLHVHSADYRIDIYDLTNNLLKSIKGQTDKGIVDEVWDLTTANGQIRHDQEFAAKVYIMPGVAGTPQTAESNKAASAVAYPLSLYRQGSGGSEAQ
jgi:hypothetical protein